jgi:yeast amino acid transporter
MSYDKSPTDGPFDEKGAHAVTGPQPQRTGPVDNNDIRRGSRKGSLVASLKAGYGMAEPEVSDEESIKHGVDMTHRNLKARHIQLIGIGGTIGTALFVQIGRGLINGGPASLFLAFTIW